MCKTPKRAFHQLLCQHEFSFHALRERPKPRALDPLCPKRFKAVTVTVVVSASGHYELGWACCGPEDDYSRKLGRTISRGRALKYLSEHPHITAPPQEVDRKAAKMSAFNATQRFLETVGGALREYENERVQPSIVGIVLGKPKSKGAKA